ncbi:hypothetical protein BIW11_09918, partial [Tropilaelaps mercedesae]
MAFASSDSALSGLSPLQRQRVHEWLTLFSLSAHELTVWSSVRQKFVRSTTYKVPVETKVDEVCRDLFELKQFAQRIVSLLPKVTLEVVAKKIQGAFTVKEIAHWRNAIVAIQLPFRFDVGTPQRELNALASYRSADTPGDQDADDCILVDETKVGDKREKTAPATSPKTLTAPLGTPATESRPPATSSALSPASASDSAATAFDSSVGFVSTEVEHCMTVGRSKDPVKVSISPVPTVRKSLRQRTRTRAAAAAAVSRRRAGAAARPSCSTKCKIVDIIEDEPTSTPTSKRATLDEAAVNVESSEPATTTSDKAISPSRSYDTVLVGVSDEGSVVKTSSVNEPAISGAADDCRTNGVNSRRNEQTGSPAQIHASQIGGGAEPKGSGTSALDNSNPTRLPENAPAREADVTAEGNGVEPKPYEERTALAEEATSRVEPFLSGNTFKSTFPVEQYDLPVIEVPPTLKRYLLRFRVEPAEFFWWLKQRGESVDISTRFPNEIFPKADQFL